MLTNPKMKYLFIIYIVFALLIVLLYSPGLLALNPFSDNFLKQGFSIIFAVLIVVYLAWYTVKALNSDNYKHLEDTSKESIERAEEILLNFSKSQNNSATSKIAKSGLSELKSAKLKRKSLNDIINSKFDRGSITNGKFNGTINTALDTVEKNIVLLANYLQTFDNNEFKELNNSILTGNYKNDNIPDDIQEEKHQLFLSRIEVMNNINTSNEKLLLDLDKFSAEISRLDVGEVDSNSDSMIEEIKRLSEEAKYYN